MHRIALFALLLATVLAGFHRYASVEISDPDTETTAAAAQKDQERAFTVPESFAVEEMYAPEQSGSVIAITFDSQGRLVISREDSSSVRLLDTDGDDAFEEEQLVTDQVTNSQGMVFDGSDLLIVGNGPKEGDDDSGLYRVVDENGDGQGDRVEVVTRAVDGMQEHGPHNPFFGPDGYLYWAMGNHTDIRPSPAPLSPLHEWDEGVLAMDHTDPRGHARDVRAPGGKFYRKNLDAPNSEWELVVGGFRNQYDGAFNLMGELFTFDSDMEWDRGLPWFRPVRTVHAVPGGNFGWRTGSRKHPRFYLDTLPPLQEQGRGSPVGVEFYQSYRYPKAYWGAFLQGDWSRGRILMSQLVRERATYTQTRSQEFVSGQPLNVTDLAVGPDGNVYFALGGRNTKGGIYRVVYEGSNSMPRPEADTPIERVLTIPQPRSAYSRRTIREVKTKIGEARWQHGLTAVIRDEQADPKRRVRALELLQVYGPEPEENLLASLDDPSPWQVRAASTYYLGMHESEEARRELAERLHDSDPFVQRRAAEALVRTGVHPAMDVPFSAVEDVFPLLASEDRFVRYAGRTLLRRMDRNEWRRAALTAETYPQAVEGLMAYIQTIDDPSVFDVRFLLQRELELLQKNPSNSELRGLIRVMQRTMLEDRGVRNFTVDRGEEEDGEIELVYDKMEELLLKRFPSADNLLNREMARVFAYLEPTGAVGEMAAELDTADIGREQQIAYAYAMSSMQVGWDSTAVDRMTSWFEKVYNEGWRGGASFSGYISIMKKDFLKNVPDEYQPATSKRLADLQAPAVPTVSGPDSSRHGLSAQELAEEMTYDPGAFEYQEGPANGVTAYRKALCATCHKFGPLGREFGPDLTTVGQRFSRSDIVNSIVYPSRTVSSQWSTEKITRTNGETVTGIIYRENAQEVVLQVQGGGQVTIPKSEIESREEVSQSAMPKGLHHYLTRAELVDMLMLLEEGPEAIPDSMITSR